MFLFASICSANLKLFGQTKNSPITKLNINNGQQRVMSKTQLAKSILMLENKIEFHLFMFLNEKA